MNLPIVMWLFFRFLLLAAWLFFLGFSFYFWLDSAPHLNSFGHLLHKTEAMIFGSGLLAMFAGFLELMMRERAGIQRPSLGEFIPPKIDAT